MVMPRKPRGSWCGAVGVAAFLVLAGCGRGGEPETNGGFQEMRRLTDDQYRQTIADVFGPDIKIVGRLEPDARVGGLLAVGASEVAVSRAGIEAYDAQARSIAAQVLDKAHRDNLVPCHPAAAATPDAACASLFFAKYGRLLLRHPLDSRMTQIFIKAAADRTAITGSFYSGLEGALAGMLVEPEFLFRVESAEPDPAHPGSRRLDAFSKASRLSFLLWDATPDDALLTAAEHGELDRKDGLARQVDRMMASPRLEAGVRAFFSDMLQFDGFAELEKSKDIYPRFSRTVAEDAREQTLRTITDHLLVQRGDYRDLFTTRRTFMTRALGKVYRVPVAASQGWEPFEFPQDDFRAGLLSQISFTALHAHPARSSPTLRGRAIREILLCQRVPDPPANVNFAIVEDQTNPQYKTMRDRLTAHRANPTCAGCHKIMDPIGLGLERLDGLGQYRAEENGAPIDASGELDGIAFNDAAGLGRAVRDNPATVSCLVSSLYRYASGHDPRAGEKQWLSWLRQRFAADGYRLPDLLRDIATSDGFYRIAPQAEPNAQASNGEESMKETRS
jgi:hypothetical protein